MTPLEVLRLVVSKLDSLGVPYMIGGSFASSVHGVPRSTNDAGLVVNLRLDQTENFLNAFREAFLIDPAQVRQAINSKRSFNVIHLDSVFKVDFFVLSNTPYAREQFSRRQSADLEQAAAMMVATAEDTVLAKLDWFRQDGGVSERQWRDLIDVLRIQAGRMDTAYLQKWAAELGVSDLLDRARQEAEAASS